MLRGGDLRTKDDITALVLAAFTPDDCLLKAALYLPEAVLEDAETLKEPGPLLIGHGDQGFLN